MQPSKTKRRTRPEPARTQPDRTWKRNAPPTDGAAGKPHAGASPSNGAEPKQDGQGARSSSAYRTLNDAYRLVDEYLRQGQEMAENIWLPLGGNGSPAWPTPGAPERFLRAVGDMTLAWVEAMQGFASASAAPAPPPNGTAGPFQTASDAAGQTPSPVPAATAAQRSEQSVRRELGVSVEAKGRVEVCAALTEPGDPGELEATELRPAKSKAAPIRDVSVSAEAARVVIRVVVPDAQPRGTYNGLLLDPKTHKPRGTLSVVVR